MTIKNIFLLTLSFFIFNNYAQQTKLYKGFTIPDDTSKYHGIFEQSIDAYQELKSKCEDKKYAEIIPVDRLIRKIRKNHKRIESKVPESISLHDKILKEAEDVYSKSYADIEKRNKEAKEKASKFLKVLNKANKSFGGTVEGFDSMHCEKNAQNDASSYLKTNKEALDYIFVRRKVDSELSNDTIESINKKLQNGSYIEAYGYRKISLTTLERVEARFNKNYNDLTNFKITDFRLEDRLDSLKKDQCVVDALYTIHSSLKAMTDVLNKINMVKKNMAEKIATLPSQAEIEKRFVAQKDEQANNISFPKTKVDLSSFPKIKSLIYKNYPRGEYKIIGLSYASAQWSVIQNPLTSVPVSQEFAAYVALEDANKRCFYRQIVVVKESLGGGKYGPMGLSRNIGDIPMTQFNCRTLP